MEDNKDNANPTILNASQLPTRQKKKGTVRRGPDLRHEKQIFAKPDFLSRPFCDEELSWPDRNGGDLNGDLTREPIDEQEVYAIARPDLDIFPISSPALGEHHAADVSSDLISTISDPEHPLSLGQLAVVNLPDIYITQPPPAVAADPNALVTVLVEITPTITHCSLATVIGLGVRVRLEQALPPNYRVDVRIKENTHSQDDQVNKQLADKERVAAALENETLRGVLDKMLETCA